MMIPMLRCALSSTQPCRTFKSQSIRTLLITRTDLWDTKSSFCIRSFSSKRPSLQSQSQTQSPPTKATLLLYQRDPSRAFRPRAFMAMASFHTLYWGWYVVDFIPAVNASSASDIHVDPSVGLVGLFVAASMNGGVMWYTRRLVSEISVSMMDDMNDTKKDVYIKTHTLPFQRPSLVSNRHELGTVQMDPQSIETKRVLKGDTMWEVGHLLLKDMNAPRSPYMLHVKEEEVLNPRVLMQVLSDPRGLLEDELIEREERASARRNVKSNKTTTIRRVPVLRAKK